MDGVARLRDRDCFMRIYDYFMPRLCVYLRGLGVPDAVAEELAQESLLRLWLRAADFDPAQGALSTWLYRIARNLHIDRIRRERAWMQVQAAVEDAATLDVIERSSAEQFADQARLRQRINELPAVQARLVRMSYFEAKSHSEIAEAIGDKRAGSERWRWGRRWRSRRVPPTGRPWPRPGLSWRGGWCGCGRRGRRAGRCLPRRCR